MMTLKEDLLICMLKEVGSLSQWLHNQTAPGRYVVYSF